MGAHEEELLLQQIQEGRAKEAPGQRGSTLGLPGIPFPHSPSAHHTIKGSRFLLSAQLPDDGNNSSSRERCRHTRHMGKIEEPNRPGIFVLGGVGEKSLLISVWFLRVCQRKSSLLMEQLVPVAEPFWDDGGGGDDWDRDCR